MPCHGPEVDYSSEYREERDKVTRLLCHVLGCLEKDVVLSLVTYSLIWTPELVAWWDNHKQLAPARKEAEIKAAERKAKNDAYMADLFELQKKHGMR